MINKFDTTDIHFDNMKDMSIDFVSSKNLLITAPKEFLEIFLSSISKDMTFHFEIISGLYQYVGVELDYNDEPLNQRLKKSLFKGFSHNEILKQQKDLTSLKIVLARSQE